MLVQIKSCPPVKNKKALLIPLNSMTNEEKFKTAQERTKEFKRFCRSHRHCTDCLVRNNFLARRFVSTTDDFDCKFLWLELEAKEKRIP